MSENVPKMPMTEEERLELAKKLDEDLDAFIDGLEKRRYEDGWPEDRWEEEMDKHPFFMKSAPQDGQQMSPLAEGLARLKYDPEENTAMELANSYKEDGNFNYKHKNYRLAIIGYTEGIKIRCGDPLIEASLYNNRAACHWELQNYRSCLNDSEKALSFNVAHRKARARAIRAALKTCRFDTAIGHCEAILTETPDDKEVLGWYASAKKDRATLERDRRKKEIADKKANAETERLLSLIRSRGVRIDGDDLDLSALEPTVPSARGSRVKLVGDLLHWPVLILYPEFNTTDFIAECSEDVPLFDQLEQLFPAPWDEKSSYRIENINVYFEGNDGKAHKVDPHSNLRDVLIAKYFTVRAGTPSFLIVVKNSAAEESFLKLNT